MHKNNIAAQRRADRLGFPKTTRRLLQTTSISVLTLLCGMGQAVAQTAPTGGDTIDEVIVTGSRIARKDYTSSSPIATVSASAVQAAGAVTVERVITDMPQFRPGTTALSNYPPGRGGQSTIALRGTGANRSLVLLDGRRMQPSTGGNVIDLNTVPDALVENVEVISGGASATYGSDAIAGVVNFKLKHHFNGFEVDSQVGVTEHGGGGTQQVSITTGGDFGEGRKGNAVISLSYANREALTYSERPFYSRYGAWPAALHPAQGIVSFVPTNRPSQAAYNAVFGAYGVAPGTVTPTTGVSFNKDQTLFTPVGATNFKNPDSDIYFVERNVVTEDHDQDWYAQIPLTRYSAFGRVEYELTDHLAVYSQLNYSHYSATTRINGLGGNNVSGLLVPATNPFIPADLRALLNGRALPNAPFILSKGFSGVGPVVEDNTYDVFQIVAGARGDIPGTDWTWDLYGSHGEASQDMVINGAVSRANLTTLLNSPTGTGGTCASGYNPFGLTPVSAGCAAFLAPTAKATTNVDQDVVEANLQGKAFDLPAGELRVALGASYRRNSYAFIADPRQVNDDLIGSFNSQSANGASDVKELYVEALVPVLKDLPLVHELNLSLGYRYSDYDTVGGVHTYKAEADWELVPSVRLRGGYERAVRAPTPAELFAAGSIGSFPITGLVNGVGGDPCDIRHSARMGGSGAQVRALCVAQGVNPGLVDSYTFSGTTVLGRSVGNADLDVESADTYTVGAVWRSQFDNPLLSGLSASIDYYDIKISDTIASISVPLALNRCFNLDGSNPTYSAANLYCGLIARDPNTGTISTVRSALDNLGAQKIAGVDVQIDYMVGLDALGLDAKYGRLMLNAVISKTTTFKTQDTPDAKFVDYNGTISTGHYPSLKILGSATWQVGDFELGGRWRYLGHMVPIGCRTGGQCGKGVDDISFFDLNARWKVNQTLELRGGVNDLFDKYAPDYPFSPVSSQYGRTIDPGGYDVLGRRFYVGLKARF